MIGLVETVRSHINCRWRPAAIRPKDSADILDWRSLYGVTHTDGVEDAELAAQQAWLYTVITRMVNVVNLPGATDDSD